MKKSMGKNGAILALFAMACTALVALVNGQTGDLIKEQQQAELLRTLHQIVGDDLHDNLLSDHCILLQDPALGTEEPLTAYIATRDGVPVAIAMESIAPDGYNGRIDLIVGISDAGEVLGVRTLSHQETPGLGDKIEIRKSDWVTHFNGKRLEDSEDPRWRVKKDGGDFDQFTGATITPRAYVKAVAATLDYFNANRRSIYTQAQNCESHHE
jgi:Na+-translocating ferredoxin:NAD+ oxidoreductase subunit G